MQRPFSSLPLLLARTVMDLMSALGNQTPAQGLTDQPTTEPTELLRSHFPMVIALLSKIVLKSHVGCAVIEIAQIPR